MGQLKQRSRLCHWAKIATIAALWILLWSQPALADSSPENMEIRVIRPKAFVKRQHLELSLGALAVMNQSFVYPMMISGQLGYHFTDTFAIELSGAYGDSLDKSEVGLLKERFSISTAILRPKAFTDLRLQWAPMYGKLLLEGGNILYFDTFLSAGAGQTLIEYQFDYCADPANYTPEIAATIPQPPAAIQKRYPTMVIGLGERVQINNGLALKMNVDYRRFSYPVRDGDCQQDSTSDVQGIHNDIVLGFGLAKFL